MTKLASLILLAVCLTTVVAQDPPRVAIKFDEFGDILYSDKIARLDHAASTAQNQPQSKIFLVVYTTRRDLPGLNYRLRAQMKEYLVESRGILEDAIVTIDGGLSSNLIQQVWIVPPGTTPTPHPEAYLRQLENNDFTWEFDDFTFGNNDGPPEPDSFEPFADEVRRISGAVAYVIYYPSVLTYVEHRYDRRGKLVFRYRAGRSDNARDVRRAMMGIRRELETKYELGAKRVRIINGGYREFRSVELWVLPKNAHPPIATPNRFPKKGSSRK